MHKFKTIYTMKKILLYSFALALVFSACNKDDDDSSSSDNNSGDGSSTFSIVASDFGGIGDKYAADVDSAQVDTINMSANEGSLDLSFLNHPFRTDSTIYVDPQDYSFAATQMPEANLAMKELNNTVIFLHKTDNIVEMVGIYMKQDTTDIIIPFTDKLTLYQFPYKKGDKVSDTGVGETDVTFQYGQVPINMNIKVNAQIDFEALGDLLVKTPEGEERCLKELRSTIFTVTLDPDLSGQGPQVDSTLTYNFYAKNKGNTFVSATLNLNDSTSKEISYLKLN